MKWQKCLQYKTFSFTRKMFDAFCWLHIGFEVFCLLFLDFFPNSCHLRTSSKRIRDNTCTKAIVYFSYDWRPNGTWRHEVWINLGLRISLELGGLGKNSLGSFFFNHAEKNQKVVWTSRNVLVCFVQYAILLQFNNIYQFIVKIWNLRLSTSISLESRLLQSLVLHYLTNQQQNKKVSILLIGCYIAGKSVFISCKPYRLSKWSFSNYEKTKQCKH